MNEVSYAQFERFYSALDLIIEDERRQYAHKRSLFIISRPHRKKDFNIQVTATLKALLATKTPLRMIDRRGSFPFTATHPLDNHGIELGYTQNSSSHFRCISPKSHYGFLQSATESAYILLGNRIQRQVPLIIITPKCGLLDTDPESREDLITRVLLLERPTTTKNPEDSYKSPQAP